MPIGTRLARAGAGGLWAIISLWIAALALDTPPIRVQAAASPAGVAPQASCNNLLGDSDFEAISSPWFEFAQPITVALQPGPFPQVRSTLPISICDSEVCSDRLITGVNDPAGPASGSTWAWFGGGITDTNPITVVVQAISQPVTIPAGSTASLEFNLWISRADPGTDDSDVLRAMLGTTPVFTVTAASASPYTLGYQTVQLDVSSFATGLSTTMQITATTRAKQTTPPPVVNFNVDDVRLCAFYPLYLPMIEKR